MLDHPPVRHQACTRESRVELLVDLSVLTVAVLFAAVLLRVMLVAAVVWLLIPRWGACPECGAETVKLVLPRALRLVGLERRWCLTCGWAGVGKAPGSRPAAGRRPPVPTGPLALAVILPWTACAPAGDGVQALFENPSAWVDLTHPFNETTIYWPTAEPFRLDIVAEGMTPQGYYYAANRFQAAEHGGTHLDAPVHFAEGRHGVDEIPLTRLVGPAVVVDVSAAAAADPDYRVTVADLQAFEAAHGPIPHGAIVLFRTGWGTRWPDRRAYLGTERRGEAAVPELRFPGVAPEAARWLVRERVVDAVGIDTPSIDYGPSQTFETHRILFAENIPAFENVANLQEMPVTGAYVVALPMKIGGGSGAPLRIVGVIP